MKDFKNNFSWSKSREEMFNECKRKYYFNYYGSWGGWEKNSPEKIRQTYILKNLSNRYMWIGGAIHEIIKDYLLRLKAGKDIELQQLLDRLNRTLVGNFNDSKTGNYKQNPKYKLGLVEHEYNLLIPQYSWDELFKHAENCIINFYNSDTLKEIKKTNPKDWIIIENALEKNQNNLQSFDFEETKIWLKIDFAIKNKNKIVLYDWKTGKTKDTEMGLQLSSYAFYILKEFDIKPEDLIIKKFYLSLNKEEQFKINQKGIENLKQHIKNKIILMQEYLIDKENNIPKDEKEFPKTESDYFCNNCKFKKICI